MGFIVSAMVVHISPKELDRIHELKAKGKSPPEIAATLGKERKAKDKNAKGPDVTNARRALKWKSHKRATVETRGRKPKLSARNLKILDTTRLNLIEKARLSQSPNGFPTRCLLLENAVVRGGGVHTCFGYAAAVGLMSSPRLACRRPVLATTPISWLKVSLHTCAPSL